MNKLKTFKISINSVDNLKQFMKFGMVGILNTFISIGIYYIFIFINNDLYIVGNTVGFFVSVLNAYYWNNKYVFEKTEKGHIIPIIKTFMSYGVTFIISTFLLIVMVRYMNISKIIAPIINLVFTIPVNFLLNKFWAFR